MSNHEELDICQKSCSQTPSNQFNVLYPRNRKARTQISYGLSHRLKYDSRHFNVRPSWAKADANHVDHYRKVLQSKLKNMEIPHSAIGCQNVFCTDEEHFVALNQYAH